MRSDTEQRKNEDTASFFLGEIKEIKQIRLKRVASLIKSPKGMMTPPIFGFSRFPCPASLFRGLPSPWHIAPMAGFRLCFPPILCLREQSSPRMVISLPFCMRAVPLALSSLSSPFISSPLRAHPISSPNESPLSADGLGSEFSATTFCRLFRASG